MKNDENKLRKDLEYKEVLFQKHFNSYQRNLRKYPTYIKYDAFKDLKLIFDLYSEIFHLRGYNYSKFTQAKLKKIIEPFSNNEKRELIDHLVKSLVRNGNDDEAKEVMHLLDELEIKCSWESICQRKNIFKNSFRLIHKSVSYNSWILVVFIVIYLFFSTIIFCESKLDFMTVLEVKKIKVIEINWLNNLANLFSYIFELDEKMEVKPLNFAGVLLLSFQKSILFLIVGNYLITEIFKRIKLQ